MVGRTKSLKIYRTVMVQKADQKSALKLRVGRRLTCFADTWLTIVVGSAWHPSLYKSPVDWGAHFLQQLCT